MTFNEAVLWASKDSKYYIQRDDWGTTCLRFKSNELVVTNREFRPHYEPPVKFVEHSDGMPICIMDLCAIDWKVIG